MSIWTRMVERLSTLAPPPTVSVHDLDAWGYNGQTTLAPSQESLWDGGKFAGGFGVTQLQTLDYWTLRARSAQLFRENHYARGILRRFVTNVINTGLSPECTPEEEILGLQPDALSDWTETVETRFALWGKTPDVCDWYQQLTFGSLQRAAFLEALAAGDVLVVLRNDQRTRLPRVQLVPGDAVRTPYAGTAFSVPTGHSILHGVERDGQNRVVAYWLQQADLSFKRQPARGEKSGRRLAWLVFGTDKRLDDVRGEPLLSVVLQSLKEIDRYRDSTQRKAVINSLLALFIKKTGDKPGTLPFQGAAMRQSTGAPAESNVPERRFNFSSYMPGMIIEELQQGEEPVLKGGEGTDLNFGPFEDAMLASIAWCLELPPEILRLSFSSNYSASQAAINEVKIAINLRWGDWGETFCTPVFSDWLVSEALRGKIDAPGLLESWRDPRRFDEFAAWTSADWYGSIKPSTDMLKQGRGSQLLLSEGWTTNARESRVLTGTKYSRNVKRLKRENEQKRDAMQPLLEMRQALAGGGGGGPTASALAAQIQDMIDDALEDIGERVAATGER